jgi:predicted RNase H-like nuclease
VFPAPIRPALAASTRKEADGIAKLVDGRGVGAQAWGLYERIREVDRLVRASPLRRRFIYEVHPEVTFATWNGGAPIVASKKSAEGASARRRLVDAHFGAAFVSKIRKLHSARLVADDDILDALAALWTAERIWQGQADVIPDPPPVDSLGIEMGMWH